MELTEKQKAYKEKLFKTLKDEIEYCERKKNRAATIELGRTHLYEKTIQNIKVLLEKEWTKENFSKLVNSVVHTYDFAEYAKEEQ